MDKYRPPTVTCQHQNTFTSHNLLQLYSLFVIPSHTCFRSLTFCSDSACPCFWNVCSLGRIKSCAPDILCVCVYVCVLAEWPLRLHAGSPPSWQSSPAQSPILPSQTTQPPDPRTLQIQQWAHVGIHMSCVFYCFCLACIFMHVQNLD